MTAEAAIVVRNAVKRYGALTALNNVSLTVAKNSFFGLLGPNGAGKTTLIGALGGLVRMDDGDATVLGNSISTAPLAVRANIGIVPQELTYDPFLRVREALVFQSKYYGLGNNSEWIDLLLEKLQLGDKANENTRKLSGGMKRRLMIAQALVHKPLVIVLDEPTAGVDINLRLSLWNFIRELKDNGHTIILTTHYLEEAEALCDEVALMNRGAIVAQGKTRELLSAQTTVIQVRLRVSSPDVPADLPPYRRDGDALVFDVNNYGDIEPLLASFRRANIGIQEVAVSPPRLEDVFVRVMRADAK